MGLPAIKAKIDTGARTSALHAYSVVPFSEAGSPRVRFSIHPLQRRTDYSVTCTAEIVDQRWVSDSGGHRERRYVISTPLRLSDEMEWEIEMTLTSRDSMMFRMLLGRTAMSGLLAVDPSRSYVLGKPATSARRIYRALGHKVTGTDR